MSRYYTPSGKFSPRAFAHCAWVCALAVPLLGVVYAYADWYSPSVYLSGFITLAFGIGIALILVDPVYKWGKVRNRITGTILGACAASVAWYVSWAVWVDLVVHAGNFYGASLHGVPVFGVVDSTMQWEEVVTLLLHPALLWETIVQINAVGVWSFGGIAHHSVHGLELWGIWVAEAALIIGTSGFLGYMHACKPYSERKDEWLKEVSLPNGTPITNVASFKSLLESGSTDAFDGIAHEPNDKLPHTSFALYTLDHGAENYLLVMARTPKRTDPSSLDANTIVDYIEISEAQKQSLMRRLGA